MKWMLALCLCAGIGCQTTQSASMDPLPQWEYETIRSILRLDKLKKLEELGVQGWEVASVWVESDGSTWAMLKRPIRLSENGNRP